MKVYQLFFACLSLLMCIPFIIYTADERAVLRSYENDVLSDWNEDCSQMCGLNVCCAYLCCRTENKGENSRRSLSSQKKSLGKRADDVSITQQTEEEALSSEQPQAKDQRGNRVLGFYGFPSTPIIGRKDPRSGIVRVSMV